MLMLGRVSALEEAMASMPFVEGVMSGMVLTARAVLTSIEVRH